MNSTSGSPTRPPKTETWLVWMVGAVQLVVVVDFMMFLPLGPDLVEPLAIDPSDLGLIVAAYTGSAALAGLLGSMFLDRVGRRVGLTIGLLGLSLSTLCAAASVDLTSLAIARMVAGLFGGPVAALVLTTVADAVPAARRGRAIGAVMGANAIATIVAIPSTLWLADVACWQAPLVAVGTLGLGIAVVTQLTMPPLREHLDDREQAAPLRALLAKREVLAALALTFLVMGTSFLLTPNLSAYVQSNLDIPREQLPRLYFVAGLVSLFAMRGAGRLVDRFGAFVVALAAAALFVAVVSVFLLPAEPVVPIVAGFILLMVSLTSRNVAVQTLNTQVPDASHRASFLSLQTSARHLAAAAGAGISAVLLSSRADGSLVGMERIGVVVIVAAIVALPLLRWVETTTRRG